MVLGAGSAGAGISDLMARSLVEAGVPEGQATERFYLIDKDGLLTDDRKGLLDFQARYAQPRERVRAWQVNDPSHIGLEEVVQHAHPSILLGVTGQPGLFTEAALREMARHVERPLVFPLSNPTSRSEATPSDIMAWTDGRAVIGTGSPFPPVKVGERDVPIDQVNNAYVFPGIGLGVTTARARRMTESMFLAAARALAEISPARENPRETLLPPLSRMRNTAWHVARAVALQAHREGLATGFDAERAGEVLREVMWEPVYAPYRPAGG